MKKHKTFKLVLLAATAFLAFSCRTVPPQADMESSVSLLPEGSDVIIYADIRTNTELFEPVLEMLQGLPPKLTKEFLERTEVVWAGLDFDTRNSEDDSWMPVPTFKSSIVAKGDYPASTVEWGLRFERNWKKEDYNPLPDMRSNVPYWYEKEGENQIVMPNDQYLMASAGEIKEMIGLWAAGTAMPADGAWINAEKSADLVILTRNLVAEDYGKFIPQFSRVPLESLLIKLNRKGADYEISGRFEMENEVSSFLFATLFRTMVIAAKTETGEKLFGNPLDISIKKDGSSVVLDGMVLPVAQVAAVEARWLGIAGMNE
ncbi:MAG: hypothetical protein PQJ61_11910 [Spirochaetales bacterium]|uniref:Uncharacterized protein n=1 Tax=Candidatus Thalassospirochaeta sargassi TaxID=3119039 RepID=A0AAJ1IDW2_9SPIO|nr:hypothetical protein [Spirochaetales bacterium]